MVVPWRLRSCVIVCARPFFSGRPRLRAVQRLHLAQHSTNACSGATCTAHDVFELIDELWSRKTLKPRQMRLQASGLSVAHHRGADPKQRSHLARASVRGRLGLNLRGQLYQPGNVDLCPRRAARGAADRARAILCRAASDSGASSAETPRCAPRLQHGLTIFVE